jgi:aspartate--ammonia ligase
MQTFVDKVKSQTLIGSGLETEIAIDLVKTTFSTALTNNLNLFRVTSPIAVEENTGINDDLNGVERAVTFPIPDMHGSRGVVVQSLAKWKRLRLYQLGLKVGQGIITDMKALRPDEKLSSIHSIFVDQWDWEKVISREERSIDFLKSTVNRIYDALLQTEQQVFDKYPQIVPVLPKTISFIHAQELLNMYPNLSSKEREVHITRAFGAVFIFGIGGKLSNGEPHDGRVPDYDDWSTPNSLGFDGLNGDILVWNPVSQSALELSSMGVRVDKHALQHQLHIRGCADRANLMFHSMLLSGELPLSIGGGIGQSRVCMFMLRKMHIGEVQASIWPNHTRLAYDADSVQLI